MEKNPLIIYTGVGKSTFTVVSMQKQFILVLLFIVLFTRITTLNLLLTTPVFGALFSLSVKSGR